MAPSLTETITASLPTLSLNRDVASTAPTITTASTTKPTRANVGQWNELDPALGYDDPSYAYKQFKPTYSQNYKLPPLEPFGHKDPGKEALTHAEPREFLKSGEHEEITPDFGSEVSGVDLTQLDKRGREQLALFVAERGVVAFRGQENFINADPKWQIHDFAATYGRVHTHPTSGQPEGHPELHLVYRDGQHKGLFNYDDKLTSTQFHSDVTYELQPPGLTTLFLYDGPNAGGDTVFTDQRATYNALSPSFRAYLETLQVLHSGVAQAQNARSTDKGDIVKREPVENIHPLVRRHPVTGEKALFVNKGFSRHIIGLKKEESDALLNLLYAHIAQGADYQARVRWRKGTVVLWDNRITVHSAIFDYKKDNLRRHGARLTPQAERPFL